jgi:hypothetical protein
MNATQLFQKNRTDAETRKRVIREDIERYLKNAFTKENPIPIYISTDPKSKYFHGSEYKISIDELERVTREILKPMDTRTHRFIVDHDCSHHLLQGFLVYGEPRLMISIREV